VLNMLGRLNAMVQSPENPSDEVRDKSEDSLLEAQMTEMSIRMDALNDKRPSVQKHLGELELLWQSKGQDHKAEQTDVPVLDSEDDINVPVATQHVAHEATGLSLGAPELDDSHACNVVDVMAITDMVTQGKRELEVANLRIATVSDKQAMLAHNLDLVSQVVQTLSEDMSSVQHALIGMRDLNQHEGGDRLASVRFDDRPPAGQASNMQVSDPNIRHQTCPHRASETLSCFLQLAACTTSVTAESLRCCCAGCKVSASTGP
jgi:hypothetical protein